MEKLERGVADGLLCAVDFFDELLYRFEQDGLELPRLFVERLFPRSPSLFLP